MATTILPEWLLALQGKISATAFAALEAALQAGPIALHERARAVEAGGAGSDVHICAGRSERFVDSTGDDFYLGGAGVDTLSFENRTQGVYVLGDVAYQSHHGALDRGQIDRFEGVETLRGTKYNDRFELGANAGGTGVVDRTVFGMGGSDRIVGGTGSDRLYGGAGDDRIHGGKAGGASPDRVDMLDGGAGQDTMTGGAATAIMSGGSGDDLMVGGAADDTLSGDSDQDRLDGGDGNDRLDGGSGDDRLSGGVGDDRLEGGVEQDGLFGGAGDDRLIGGAGDDRMYGGAGDDRLDGGVHQDILYGGSGDDRLDGGEGNDRLAGGAGDDRLVGGQGEDHHDLGGGGVDTVVSGAGYDWYVPAEDTAAGIRSAKASVIFSGEAAPQGLAIDFAEPLFTIHNDGWGVGEALPEFYVAGVIGNAMDDHIRLANRSAFVRGMAGDDTIAGGRGADAIEGGAGDDLLSGGAGGDVFIYRDARWGSDTITDFDRRDHIMIDMSASAGFNAGSHVEIIEGADGVRIQLETIGGMSVIVVQGEVHGLDQIEIVTVPTAQGDLLLG